MARQPLFIGPAQPRAILFLPFVTLILLLSAFALALGLPASQAAPLPEPLSLAQPGPGQARINEVMRNPACIGDGLGEYFELHNTSASQTFDLQGCVVRDDDGQSFTIAAALPIAPGGYAVLCLNGNPAVNGGIACHYDYAGLALDNTADELVLSCGAAEVSRIVWDNGQLWPHQEGASMMFCGPKPVGDGWSWLDSTQPIFPGACSVSHSNDLGSPGRYNDCPAILSASKRVTPAGPATYGQTLNYQITFSNTGLIPAANLRVTDTHSVLGSRLLAGPIDFPVGSASLTYDYIVRPADCFTTLQNSVLMRADSAPRPGLSDPVNTPVSCIGPRFEVVKRSSPSFSFIHNAVITSLVMFTNTGDLSDTMWIADPAPAIPPGLGLSAACSSNPPGWPSTAAKPYGHLDLGESGSIAVTCALSAEPALVTRTLRLDNVATATCATAWPDPQACPPVSASASLTLTALPIDPPVLNVIKTAGPAITLTHSGQITYNVTIENQGGYTASLALSDSGPPDPYDNLALACSSNPPGLPAAAGLPLGDLAIGQSLSVALTCQATITQTTQPQTFALPNVATASCGDGLCTPASASAALTITAPALQPRLQLAKTVQPAAVFTAGAAVLTFTVSIANSGDYTGTFLLSDPGPVAAPAGLGFDGCQPAVPYSASLTLRPGQALAPPLRLECRFPTTPGLQAQSYAVSNTASVTVAETGESGQAIAVATVDVPALHPAIALSKAAWPSWQSITATAQVTYTIALTNSGQLAATFALADAGPAALPGLQLVGCSPAFPINETLPLGPGQALDPPRRVVCTYSVTQDVAPQTFVLNNLASVSIVQTGATAQAASAATIAVPALTPGVSLNKSASTSAVFAGAVVTYTYQVLNSGETYLTPVTVIDDQLGLVCSRSVPVAPGAAFTCQQATAIVTDTVNVATATAQPANAAGQAYATAPLTTSDDAAVALLRPRISLSKQALPAMVEIGQPVTYTYRVANIGNTHLQPVVVTDDVEGVICILGAGLAPGGQAACTWHSTPLTSTLNTGLASGQPATAAGLPLPSGPVTATATAFVQVTPLPRANLVVSKISDPIAAEPGSAVAYSIHITNTGPAEARSVRVTDTLPSRLNYLIGSAGCGHSGISPGGRVLCNVGPMAPGSSQLLVVIANVTAGPQALVTNVVTATTASVDLVPANNTASVATYLGPLDSADLQIVKLAELEQVGDQRQVHFAVQIANAGPDAATGVQATDTLPADVAFLSASPGCAHSGATTGGSVTCSLPNGLLLPTTGVTFTIVTRVAPTTSVLIDNNATVTSEQQDLNLANNSAHVVIPAPRCDVDGDNDVDIVDAQSVAGAWLATAAMPGWSPAHDLYRDDVIDVQDLVLAGQCWLAHAAALDDR